MLRKIDCVMIKVDDLAAARRFYAEVFGMRPLWSDSQSAGLVFPESDSEIVLHTIEAIPAKVDVNYLVSDVVAETRRLAERGCRVVAGPFEIPIGKCAVIADPFGTALTLVDMTKGPRPPD
jgi:predicted enzyme related to lactoylglutathione lyase